MKTALSLLCIMAFVLTGCTHSQPTKIWRLEPVCSIPGFKTPECAEVNPDNGMVYVANIFAVTRDTIGALDGPEEYNLYRTVGGDMSPGCKLGTQSASS